MGNENLSREQQPKAGQLGPEIGNIAINGSTPVESPPDDSSEAPTQEISRANPEQDTREFIIGDQDPRSVPEHPFGKPKPSETTDSKVTHSDYDELINNS